MRTAVVVAASLVAWFTASPARSAPAAATADEAVLFARCMRGFAADCTTAGRARLTGEGVARDDRLAAALLTHACETGDPAGCSDLGVLYAIGRGVAQSDERAAALSRRACDRGAAIACSNEGTLLAEGAAPAPARGPGSRGEKPGSKIVRLFRAACDAGIPVGCVNLATALDAGKLAPREIREAARAYRRACDAGLALACHRLALLVSERPDVAPDLTGTALEARACAAAVAPACFANGDERPPAESALTPAAKLVNERSSYALGIPGSGGFSPGELSGVTTPARRRAPDDVRRPPAALQAAVPPDIRERLAVALPARAGTSSDPPVELLVSLRRHELGQCYEGTRQAAGARTEMYTTFFVDGDGRPVEVRAAGIPADDGLESCVRELVSHWEFPSSPEGTAGPYLARYVFEAAPPGSTPGFAAPDFLRPALRDPACVGRTLRMPAEYRGSTGSLTVKVAVDSGGKPALVHALTFAPDEIERAVAEAVLDCAWSGGADPEGHPVSLWATLTVKLDGR